MEDRLDDGLVGMIRPKTDDLSEPDEDVEFQQVQAAVLRECILNLARIKEAITQNVGGTLDAAGLDSWHDLMRGMKAGLLMLGKSRAVEVIEAVTTQLKRVMQPGGRAAAGWLHGPSRRRHRKRRVLHGNAAGRPQRSLVHAGQRAGVRSGARATTNTGRADRPADGPVRICEDGADFHCRRNDHRRRRPGRDHGRPGTSAIPPSFRFRGPLSCARWRENADPELVKLFIEEAHEELAKIQRHFPAWDQNPMDRESLVTVRRSFHTLKGSGRMVGARELGEFAWSIENLLNRVLDNTLTRTPAILTVLRESVAALPELIEQLETARKPRADMTEIASRAHALAAGKTPTTTARAAAVEAPPD